MRARLFIFPPRPDLTRAGLKNRPVGRPRAAEAPPKIMGKGGSRPGPPRPRKKRLARRPPRGSQKARPRLGTPTNLIELGHRRLERLFTAEVILNNILYLPKERRRASRHAPPRAYALVRGRPGRRTPEAESDLLSPAHRRSVLCAVAHRPPQIYFSFHNFSFSCSKFKNAEFWHDEN